MIQRLYFLFFVFVCACSGPTVNVDIPSGEQEKLPVIRTYNIPNSQKVQWKINPPTKPVSNPISFETYKDSVFSLQSFLPLTHQLDSICVKSTDLPSVDLDIEKLKQNKVNPSYVLLGLPVKTKVLEPKVEDQFTKGLIEIGQDQGLPGNEVTSIEQDKLGRLWMCTDNGLSLYDGENIYSWYKRLGLSRDVKNNISIDSAGHIWAAGSGVDEIIPELGIVKHYGKKEGLTSNRVVSVYVAKNGLVYISQVEGIDILDPKTNTVKHIGEKEGLSIYLNINVTRVDHKGRIWAGSNCGGVNIYDPAKKKLFKITDKNGLGNSDCRTITVDRSNRVWMGLWNGGVDCYDFDSGTLLHLDKKQGLSFNYIFNVMEDSKGLIWISCLDKGLDVFDPVTRKLSHVYGKVGIVKSTVCCSFEDSEGRIWFGTTGGGLLKYDKSIGDIDNYGTHWWPTKRPILALMQDSSERIWLSTVGKGSVIYDPHKTTMTYLNHGKDWTNAFQMDLADDGKGNMFFCNDYKFVLYNAKESVFKYWDGLNGLPVSGGRCLKLFNDGALMGSPSGFVYYNTGKKQFSLLGLANGDTLKIPITCLLVSRNNKVWIGTTSNGLYEYDPAQMVVRNYTLKEGLSTNLMNSLAEDVYGRIWVGYVGNGITVLDPKNNTIQILDQSNGLAEMTVTSLLIDGPNAYVGTIKGLSIVNYSEKEFNIKNVAKSQGLRTLDFNLNAALKTKDGSIWWGIGDMLTRYRPQKIDQQAHQPFITSLDVMENEIHFLVDTSDLSFIHTNDTIWSPAKDTFYFKSSIDQLNKDLISKGVRWTKTEGPYKLGKELILPYDLDHLTFHFTGNYLSNCDKVEYKYLLDGLDKKWSPNVNRSYVDYRNLPPGNYDFKICARNYGGEWSVPASFKFKITPPWWKSNLAYVLYVLIMLGIVFGYNRIRIAKLLERQKELENVVDERTKEIALQKKNIEEKQKEIVDSINYAKRIQFALLAHEKVLKKNFNDHFILFQPKDIVSGDFYWATKIVTENNDRNEKELFYLAVCDSTGHGVPGAFMSLLNISFLNEAINEKHITEPNEILNYVRERLVSSISRDGAKDGMDGILICMENNENQEEVKILYSAGNNAPLHFSNGKLTEKPFNKMPIGKGEKNEAFTLYELVAKKGDVVYLYTDGFADQFGGPKGKKYKYKQLNELLEKNANRSMEEQKNILQTALNEWKGEFEQVDDICVVGIRV